MRSTFTSSMLTLIVALCAVLCMTTSTVSAQCKGCFDDVLHSIPSCEKADNTKREHFSDYTPKDQQCLCKAYQDPTIVLKCKPLCPYQDFDTTIELSKAMYSMYCNNTVMANGGPVGGKNAAVGAFSSISMVLSGLVTVAMSVALAIVA
ncbi:hypothetical protein BGZ83_000651 [Gryganskiella cystojenkinii]|nr:hypothetical protein BGZ83_000651 [Gryganskiella cystojenkinii]